MVFLKAYLLLKKKRNYNELYEICDKTNTSRTGIEHLIKYYIESLGWTEEKAIEYAIGLFHNGTIEQIKFIGKDGEEL